MENTANANRNIIVVIVAVVLIIVVATAAFLLRSPSKDAENAEGAQTDTQESAEISDQSFGAELSNKIPTAESVVEEKIPQTNPYKDTYKNPFE